MNTKEKVTIEVNEVAWTDGKCNKWQAVAQCGDKRIFSDPMPTEDKAVDSLVKEAKAWRMASILTLSEIEERDNKKDAD